MTFLRMVGEYEVKDKLLSELVCIVLCKLDFVMSTVDEHINGFSVEVIVTKSVRQS